MHVIGTEASTGKSGFYLHGARGETNFKHTHINVAHTRTHTLYNDKVTSARSALCEESLRARIQSASGGQGWVVTWGSDLRVELCKTR